MYKKLLTANQSLMLIIAIALIVMLFQTDNSKRLGELEQRLSIIDSGQRLPRNH